MIGERVMRPREVESRQEGYILRATNRASLRDEHVIDLRARAGLAEVTVSHIRSSALPPAVENLAEACPDSPASGQGRNVKVSQDDSRSFAHAPRRGFEPLPSS